MQSVLQASVQNHGQGVGWTLVQMREALAGPNHRPHRSMLEDLMGVRTKRRGWLEHRGLRCRVAVDWGTCHRHLRPVMSYVVRGLGRLHKAWAFHPRAASEAWAYLRHAACAYLHRGVGASAGRRAGA